MTPRPRDLEDIAKDLPKEAPALHEIAAMPFPASMVAMRRFYNKDWHKPEHDGESPGKWRVEVTYTRREEDVWEADIEAACEADARRLGEEAFDKAHRWDSDIEIEDLTVEFKETAQ